MAESVCRSAAVGLTVGPWSCAAQRSKAVPCHPSCHIARGVGNRLPKRDVFTRRNEEAAKQSLPPSGNRHGCRLQESPGGRQPWPQSPCRWWTGSVRGGRRRSATRRLVALQWARSAGRCTQQVSGGPSPDPGVETRGDRVACQLFADGGLNKMTALAFARDPIDRLKQLFRQDNMGSCWRRHASFLFLDP